MPAGRPKKEIDYSTVEKLANIQCTQQEIASFLEIGLRTLQRDEHFMEIFKKGQENGKASLRRIQWKHAEKSASMAMFLGKQYLGQRDVMEQQHEVNNGIIDNLVEALKNDKDN